MLCTCASSSTTAAAGPRACRVVLNADEPMPQMLARWTHDHGTLGKRRRDPVCVFSTGPPLPEPDAARRLRQLFGVLVWERSVRWVVSQSKNGCCLSSASCWHLGLGGRQF